MIQAFYTSSSGMRAQQHNIDVISNNISNINTPGYRIRRVEFKELYNNLVEQGNVNQSVGYGVRVFSVSTMPLPNDINPLKMNINSSGYFVVSDTDGNNFYTKNGKFKSLSEDGKNYLATEQGHYVLDRNYNRIELGPNAENVVVANGMFYPDGYNAEGGIAIAEVRFNNAEALTPSAKGYYEANDNSGAPQLQDVARISSSYYEELEPITKENQIAEMTRIVQTQMAYSFNSKALQIADEIQGMVNRLRY